MSVEKDEFLNSGVIFCLLTQKRPDALLCYFSVIESGGIWVNMFLVFLKGTPWRKTGLHLYDIAYTVCVRCGYVPWHVVVCALHKGSE